MKSIIAVILLSFVGVRAEEIFIRANQIGYAARDAKVALAFSHQPLPGTFSVVAENTGEICFTNSVRPIANAARGQFTNHAELDFSAFTKAGRYVLKLDAAKSFPFAAFQGEAVYHDDVKNYATNEPTMDGTASAILMFALLNLNP